MNANSEAAEAALDRQGFNDDPPTYAESTPSEQILTPTSSTSAESQNAPVPPSDAQRAQAPVRIQKSNQNISGDFIITGAGSSKTPPDVHFKTSNSRIETTLWIEGTLPRTCFIEAHTTNSGIDLSVHMLKPKQAVHITTTTSNSNIRVALPADFHGLLTVYTTNSKHILSPHLKARSVLVTIDDPPVKGGLTYQIGGPGGHSEAILKTTNSQIKVGLTTDTRDAASREGSCMVM
ncbi:hypothetical protein MMC26_003915 [Xylographa opegraphella]|nr:hypothetical protein [Xylographa opegraphella]